MISGCGMGMGMNDSLGRNHPIPMDSKLILPINMSTKVQPILWQIHILLQKRAMKTTFPGHINQPHGPSELASTLRPRLILKSLQGIEKVLDTTRVNDHGLPADRLSPGMWEFIMIYLHIHKILHFLFNGHLAGSRFVRRIQESKLGHHSASAGVHGCCSQISACKIQWQWELSISSSILIQPSWFVLPTPFRKVLVSWDHRSR